MTYAFLPIFFAHWVVPKSAYAKQITRHEEMTDFSRAEDPNAANGTGFRANCFISDVLAHISVCGSGEPCPACLDEDGASDFLVVPQ